MAATDKVQIFMVGADNRPWTNVFHVNATTLDAAAGWAVNFCVPALVSELNSAFSAVKIVVDHLTDDTFVSLPISIPGVVSGDWLPLFNTVKVDIQVAGHGRNDGKFVRGWLHEGIVTDGVIDESVRGAFDDKWNGLIADSTADGTDLVDKDGNLWLVATARATIQERQRHRRRKKKVVTP
jgi:hypothetical protein